MAATKEAELPRGVKSSTGMMIDGIFASEAIDSSGEVLDIEGADIGDLEDGKGVLNYEHRGDDAPGASPNDVVGKIVYARKIFGEKDCENERQRTYWRKIELPFIYGICRLYDAAGHPGAVAAAAQIRDHVANAEPILARFSIEGSTLKREGQRLVHTVARRVALTMKPCNRSCDSGLLADPQAPEGFQTRAADPVDPLEHLAEKFEHPGYARLGSGPEFSTYTDLDPESLDKAITGGGGNAAPSTLTQGSALQREDEGLQRKKVYEIAKAAYRAWDQTTDFKKFLKFRLPEADPEFIDRFAAMVDDYHLKKKAEDPDAPLTIRGRPVPATPAVKKPTFDEGPGVLRTPHGSFPMYIPGRDPAPSAREAFHNAMNEEKPSKIHAYAFRNWRRAHKLLKAGKTPDAVLMHATLFSQLSPNTPVPTQELMYGHLVDTMRRHGIDARSPDFAKLKEHWTQRDNPSEWPALSPEHWQRLDAPTNRGGLRIQSDSKTTGRVKGDIGSFMLANDKFENMSNYHRMHKGLRDIVNKHGINGRAAVREMMEQKNAGNLWEARRDRAAKAGKPDPGEFSGTPIKGLAPKTARYMYSMLGAGNTVVPDTHFVRHLFGLEKGRDTASIEHLKTTLWNENNSDVLDAIDRYYGKNHDAVKHMAAHPDVQGHDIGDENLVFPAFWRHWMAIVPHEKARGMSTAGFNAYTDHKPFWDAILDHLESRQEPVKKSDQDAWARALETAKEHLHWQETLGETPAMLIYFAHLLPQLMDDVPDHATGFEDEPTHVGVGEDPNGDDLAAKVRKFEALAVDLGVMVSALRKSREEKKDPEVVEYQGQRVKPGFLEIHSGEHRGPHAILGSDASHFHVVPAPQGLRGLAWSHDDVQKLPRVAQDNHYDITRYPQTVDTGLTVDSDLHGHPTFNTTAAQRKLVHGLDFGADAFMNKEARVGNGSEGHWRHGPQGVVYVKGDTRQKGRDEQALPAQRREMVYHNLARDVFGFGDSLAPTALIRHPRSGKELSVVGKIPGAVHYGDTNKAHQKALSKLGDSGALDRAATMNWIFGNWDRGSGNWMLAPDKGGQLGFKLIDHGHALTKHPDMSMDVPDYLEQYHRGRGGGGRYKTLTADTQLGVQKLLADEPLHSSVGPWVQKLDADDLWKRMKDLEVPDEHANAAVTRLRHLQSLPALNRLGDVFDHELVYDDMGNLRKLGAP